jgi:Protein of unknown function (DUF3253)
VKSSDAAGQGANADPFANPATDLQALEAAIFDLLAKRKSGSTICPSDTARAVYPATAQWRAAMPAVRAVAAQLVAQGKLVVTQGGKVVDIHTAKGPIRLRLPPPGSLF